MVLQIKENVKKHTETLYWGWGLGAVNLFASFRFPRVFLEPKPLGKEAISILILRYVNAADYRTC